MDLGAFSVSLAVKDIEASRSFYEKLGFTVMGGDQSQGWRILMARGRRISSWLTRTATSSCWTSMSEPRRLT